MTVSLIGFLTPTYPKVVSWSRNQYCIHFYSTFLENTPHLPHYILRKFEKHLRFLRTGKMSLHGGGEVLFSCLQHYSNLLLIFQNKIVKYTWVPPPRRPEESAALNLLGIHHRHLYTCSHRPGTTFKSGRRQPHTHLWYERNNHILVVSSGNDKNKQ